MAQQKRVLILGGTSDATKLAEKISELPEVEAIVSLAGRTRQPVLPQNTRIGGFNGVTGLIDYLREQRINGLIDATHPFADQISFNAVAAAGVVGIPHLMLSRPPWQPVIGDQWIEVDSHEAAATLLTGLAQRIFLTIGRQELATFAPLQTLWFLMRMIDPPQLDPPIPPGKLLLERGPFSLEEERRLLQHYKIEAIVSKNSGGAATYAKIAAAGELSLPVIMIRRPSIPRCEKVETIEDALAWITHNFIT